MAVRFQDKEGPVVEVRCCDLTGLSVVRGEISWKCW